MSSNGSNKYIFKIILCGDWAVGKTSLVRRFATNTFTEDYLTTIAMDVTSKELVVDSFNVNLALWDTSGQERFSALRKRYYQGAHGVIFVFDITRPESYRAIEKRWIPEVNEVLEDYISALWGTKSDLAEQRVVSTNSGDRLARRMKAYFFETSSLSGENVEKAFTSLSRLVLSKALTSSKKETSFTI
ncbi:MAG: Rab family GTPase [Candidatus Hermodarchaeia archaeon]